MPGLLRFDHIVGNVELGQMDYWADWYGKILGFKRLLQFDEDQISTEFSALMSIVMSDNSYAIKFPINEPASGRRKSQIEEYLEFNRGAGVQHIAMLTSDIVKDGDAIDRKRRSGSSRFPTHITSSSRRESERSTRASGSCSPLGILADRDEEGYLLQLFTQPVVDRPTLFFEIIQRKGSPGLRRRELQSPFRGHRAGTGETRQPLTPLGKKDDDLLLQAGGASSQETRSIPSARWLALPRGIDGNPRPSPEFNRFSTTSAPPTQVKEGGADSESGHSL